MRNPRHLYDTPAEPPPAWLLLLMGVAVTPAVGALLWALMWAWIVLAFWLEGSP